MKINVKIEQKYTEGKLSFVVYKGAVCMGIFQTEQAAREKVKEVEADISKKVIILYSNDVEVG